MRAVVAVLASSRLFAPPAVVERKAVLQDGVAAREKPVDLTYNPRGFDGRWSSPWFGVGAIAVASLSARSRGTNAAREALFLRRLAARARRCPAAVAGLQAELGDARQRLFQESKAAVAKRAEIERQLLDPRAKVLEVPKRARLRRASKGKKGRAIGGGGFGATAQGPRLSPLGCK